MHDRVLRETEMVRAKYPRLQHGEHLDWVLIPDYPLPAGRYDQDQTRLLFVVPPGYPNTAPDSFFVDIGLKLKDGGTPPAFNPGASSSAGPAPVGTDWAWFSWHPQSWRPAATIEGGDNLSTFLRGVNMCLRGEEAT